MVSVLQDMQSCASILVLDLRMVQQQVHAELASKLQSLLCEPAVLDLLLQQLTVYTALLHQEYEEFRQHLQQQQQQHASGHSSSNSSQAPSPALLQQQQQHLKQIPAFHHEVAKLLHGGQEYLDAATAAAANQWCDADRLSTGAWHARRLSLGLRACIVLSYCGSSCSPPHSTNAPVLSAAAMRLVLELQLLAASAVQRLAQQHNQQQGQQQGQQQPEQQEEVTHLPFYSNGLLHAMFRAFLQSGSSSCLPPEVLQQAGLQLLRALAAPVLQLSRAETPLLCIDDEGRKHLISRRELEHQLYLLIAAADGLPSPQQQHVVSGKAFTLGCLQDNLLAHHAVCALLSMIKSSLYAQQCCQQVVCLWVKTNAMTDCMTDCPAVLVYTSRHRSSCVTPADLSSSASCCLHKLPQLLPALTADTASRHAGSSEPAIRCV
jgi:hypothetical protein